MPDTPPIAWLSARSVSNSEMPRFRMWPFAVDRVSCGVNLVIFSRPVSNARVIAAQRVRVVMG